MKSSLSGLIVVLLAFAGPAFAERLELPTEGLESRVEFWKKVFTQYGKDDLIVHDRIHVNLIYDIASDSNVKAKVRDVENALTEIRNNLGDTENLSNVGRQIHSAIVDQGLAVTASLLSELRTNIHTQRGIKERFRDGIVRSGRYIDSFREVMGVYGVPVELALLPLVESSFENVRSKAGANGIWQFTTGTGRMYMRISGGVDERLDAAKATVAAAKLLRDNYKALGNWPLAITAYNHGRAGMLRAQRGHGPEITTIINDYRGPLFGYASMNFYAEFLAAVEVYNTHEQYFGTLALDRPQAPRATSVAAGSAPRSAPATAATASEAQQYRVRKGDTLWDIARRFGTSIANLMEANGLEKSAIYVGQMLLVQ